MSFYDLTFVGLDDDAVAADEPLDVYLEAALRSNVRALLSYGQRCTWAPMTYDADDADQKIGCMPYASLAYSSMLNVPWIIQPGQEAVEITAHYRAASEHSGVGGTPGAGTVLGRLTLSGANATAILFDNTFDSVGDDWSIVEGELTLLEPAPAEAIIDLRLELRSVSEDEITTEPYEYKLSIAGTFMTRNAGSGSGLLYEAGTAARPDSSDRAIEMIRWREDGVDFDILSAQDSSLTADSGFVRPVESGPVPTVSQDDSARRALSYLQTRGIEVRNRFDVDWRERARQLYDPQRGVEGRDEVAHALAIDRLYKLKRPLWIGPLGEIGAAESDYAAGHGPRFARVTGSTSDVDILRASIHPVTDEPVIRVLANVMVTWGGRSLPIASYPSLAEWTGRADWTLTASVERYTDAGGTTPVVVNSGSTEQRLDCYPRVPTAVSAAVTTEALLDGFNIGALTFGAIDRAYKEGQLFAEDYALQQLMVVDVDVRFFDPTTADEPLFVRLSASVDSSTLTFPELEDESTPSVAVSDLTLVVTGASIWEVPQ